MLPRTSSSEAYKTQFAQESPGWKRKPRERRPVNSWLQKQFFFQDNNESKGTFDPSKMFS